MSANLTDVESQLELQLQGRTAVDHIRRYLRFRCVRMRSLRLGCVGFSGVFRAALLLGRWLAWGFLCMMR